MDWKFHQLNFDLSTLYIDPFRGTKNSSFLATQARSLEAFQLKPGTKNKIFRGVFTEKTGEIDREEAVLDLK